MKKIDQIEFNKKSHNQTASKYESLHTEIFNSVEQARLYEKLKEVKSLIKNNSGQQFTALDIGCGSGNLTRHLLEIGFLVTAGDVSEVFLEKINSNLPEAQTLLLNGENLVNVPNDTFDLVVTYSVLHHIPDYEKMVGEMCRVLKPGGVLYIDHEHTENKWNGDDVLRDFYKAQSKYLFKGKWKRLLTLAFYINRVKRLFNPKYQAEGDIHVFPDDFIRWTKIKDVCREHGLTIVQEDRFLNYNSLYNDEIYKKYKNMTHDMGCMIAQK